MRFFAIFALSSKSCNLCNKMTKKMIKFLQQISMVLILAFPFAMPAVAAPLLMGDVDASGRIDVADVSLLISHILGKGGDIDLMAADVNGDASLDVGDVVTIIAIVLNNKPQIETVTLRVNGVSFSMVLVQGGTFRMGCTTEIDPDAFDNESPVHQVTVGDYYIGQTEVTQELWTAVMGKNPSGFLGNLQNPVEHVTLFECAVFVDKLTELTGKVFRLPTEAEWEFAARGGNFGHGYRFAGSNNAMDVAWLIDNLCSSPHVVAGKMPNELGLYDMSGNVMEWCQDFFARYDAAPQTNPCGPESGTVNVVRGGSWDLTEPYARVTYRGSMSPYECSCGVGLRLAMNI